MTQNSQMQFLNALAGLIPWSSQCSLVRKGIEKAIFCFSAWVGGKHSKFHLLQDYKPIFYAETETKQDSSVCFTFAVIFQCKVKSCSCTETWNFTQIRLIKNLDIIWLVCFFLTERHIYCSLEHNNTSCKESRTL